MNKSELEYLREVYLAAMALRDTPQNDGTYPAVLMQLDTALDVAAPTLDSHPLTVDAIGDLLKFRRGLFRGAHKIPGDYARDISAVINQIQHDIARNFSIDGQVIALLLMVIEMGAHQKIDLDADITLALQLGIVPRRAPVIVDLTQTEAAGNVK